MFYISLDGKQIYKPLDDLLILFNPRLTLEMGKAGSLEFDIPQKNPYYDKLNQLTTEVTVDMDSEEIFHGRVLSVQRAFNNVRHVYCEGDLSYLIDSVQKGVQYSGTTHDLFSRIIANHNARVDANKRFVVGTVNIENRSIVLVGQSNSENMNAGNIDYKQIAIDSIVDEWNNSFDYIQTCLIDYCGGYLRTRRVNGTIYIDLLQDFGNTSIQEIELGRNMLDLTEELSVEDVFTVLIPLGDDNLTIASVNGGSDELVDRAGVARFGRIVRTHVFSNVTNASTLLENGRRLLASSVNVPRTISVRAVDLHLVNKSINPIKIGDKVTITSYVHEVNDALTCTKIEYDLEHPEQNNYTFGNPRQTLTQRYREDVRLKNDAYGNSAASPTAASAKSAAAASAAAAKKADTEKDKALKDFYDTWIKENKEEGEVSLGALYKKYIGDREYLINKVGIDLDAKTGNLNIESIHKTVTDQGRIIAENTANINIIQTDTEVAIQNVTDRQDHLANVEATHHTEITQRCDELGSSIDLMARDINEFEDRTTAATANINMRADDMESRIGLNASYIGTIDNREVSHFATIQAWANETESALELKADKVYVDGLLEAQRANIEDLTAGRTTASKIRATNIIAGSIQLWSEEGGVSSYVASMAHSHNFAIIEGNNGNIEISIGTATNTYPQKQSFNIANTKFYKDNVAAVTIKSFALDTDAQYTDGTGYRYESGNKRFLVYVKAILSDDTDGKRGGPLYIPARDVYDAGVADGTSAITVKSHNYEQDENGATDYTKLYVVLGTEDKTIKTIGNLDISESYGAGQNNARPRAIVRRTNLATGSAMPDSWNSSTNTGYIYVRATTNNDGIYYDANIEVDTNSAIYQAGLAAGGSGGAEAVTVKSYNYEQDENGVTDYTKLYVVLGTEDKTTKTVGNLDISGSYEAGQNNARPRAIVRRTNLGTGSAMPDSWNSSTNTGYIYVRATSNNDGIYYDANIEVDTNSAIYQAGLAAGSSSSGGYVQTVTVTAATASNYGTYDKAIAPSFNSLYTSGNYSYGLANINLSNNTTTVLRYRVPAVSSITVSRTHGDMQDWDLSEENNVYINVNLSALSGSTTLATGTGRVNVNDVVNFWAPHQTRILATTSVSDSNNYDLDVDTTGYSNAYFKSGNYQYVRFELQNSNGNELGIVRVKTASTDMSISEVTGLTSDSGTYQTYNRQVSFAASSLYTPSGSSTQYARIQVNLSNGTNEVIRVAIPASTGGSVTRANYDSGYYSSSLKYYKYVGTWPNGTGYVRAQCGSAYGDLDVTDLVMEAVRIGQQSGGTTSYYWSDEKTGPYGSKQRDCYFTINGSVVQTAKVIWSSGNPSFQ